MLCCYLVATDEKLCFVCHVGLLCKVYICQYVNVFRTISFSVKNSKTVCMFLVLSKESVAFLTQCSRIFSYCHIYVNILNEKCKTKKCNPRKSHLEEHYSVEFQKIQSICKI